MSNNSVILDPIIVTPNDKPTPITIGGKPYIPGPSFGVSYQIPSHIAIKTVDLKQGQVGLINLAEFTIKIRELNSSISKYNSQLSISEIKKSILDARVWLEQYIIDYEDHNELEIYIKHLGSILNILEESNKNLSILQEEANKKFDNLLNHKIVRSSNFKKFKDNKPWLISAAYESNIAYLGGPKMKAEYIILWQENIEYPQKKILIEKQKIEASLRSALELKQELHKTLEKLDKKKENKEIKSIIEYTNTFFEHISEKYGYLAGKEAKLLAEKSKGKKN